MKSQCILLPSTGKGENNMLWGGCFKGMTDITSQNNNTIHKSKVTYLGINLNLRKDAQYVLGKFMKCY